MCRSHDIVCYHGNTGISHLNVCKLGSANNVNTMLVCLVCKTATHFCSQSNQYNYDCLIFEPQGTVEVCVGAIIHLLSSQSYRIHLNFRGVKLQQIIDFSNFRILIFAAAGLSLAR